MSRTEKLFEAVEEGNIQEVKKLLEGEATLEELTDGEKEKFPGNVNAQNEYGWTLLMKAISVKNLEIFSLLIEQGADVNKTSNNGLSPYALAVSYDLDIAKIIKATNGFKLSDQDKDHLNNFLYIELNSRRTNANIIKSLIEAGADINYVDKNGENALDIVMRKGLSKEIIQLVLNAPGFALSEKNKASLNELLQREINKPLEVIRNNPLKHIRKDYFEELLKAGADINAWDAKGNTLLINAISRGDIDIYNFLVEKNANINTANNKGAFPLDIAITERKLEMVKILLSNPDINGDVERAKDMLGLSLKGVLVKAQKERKPYINFTSKSYDIEALSSEKLLNQYKQMKLRSLYFRTDKLELNDAFVKFLKHTTESGIKDIIILCDKDQSQLTKEQFNDFIKANKIAINLRVAPITAGDLAEIEADQFGRNNLLAIKELKDYKFRYNNDYTINLLNSEESDQSILDSYAYLKEEIAKKHQSLVAYKPEYITSDNSKEEDRINISSAVAYDLEVTHETNLSLQQQIEYEHEKTSEKENELAIDEEQAGSKYNKWDAVDKAKELFKKSFFEHYIIAPNHYEHFYDATGDAVIKIFNSDSEIKYITEQALGLVVDNRHLLKYGIKLKNMPIGLAFKDGIIFASEERPASMPINGLTIKLNPLSPSIENPLQYSNLRSASKAGITGNMLYGSQVCPSIRGGDQHPTSELRTRSLEYPNALKSVAYNVDQIEQQPQYLGEIYPDHMVEQRQVREEKYHDLSYTHLTMRDKERLDDIYRNLDERGIKEEAFNKIIESGVIKTGDFLLSERSALFLDKLFSKILPINDLEKQDFFRKIINEGKYKNSYLEDIFNGTDEFYQRLQIFFVKQEISEEYRDDINNQLIETINSQSETSYAALMGRIIDVLEATAANGGNLYEQLAYIKQKLYMIGDPELPSLIKEHGINVAVNKYSPPSTSDLIENSNLSTAEYAAYLSTIPVHLRPSADYIQQYVDSKKNKEYSSGEIIFGGYKYIHEAESKYSDMYDIIRAIQEKLDEHDENHKNDKTYKDVLGVINLIGDFTKKQASKNKALLGLNILTSTGGHYDVTYPDQEFNSYISMLNIAFSEVKINEDIHVEIITNRAIRNYNWDRFEITQRSRDVQDNKALLKEKQHAEMIDNFIDLYKNNPKLNFAQIMGLGLVSNLAPDLYPEVVKHVKALEGYNQYFSQLLRISLSNSGNKEAINDFDALTARAKTIARNINFLATEIDGKPMHQILTEDGKHPENLAFFASCFSNDLEVSHDKVMQLVENLANLDLLLKQETLDMLTSAALPFAQGEIINDNFPQISLTDMQNSANLQAITSNNKAPRIAYTTLTRFNQISLDSRQNALVDLSNLKNKYNNLQWSAIEGKNYKQISAEIIRNKDFVQRILAKNSQDQALVSQISTDLLEQMLRSVSTRNDAQQTTKLLFDPKRSLTDQLLEIEASQRFINSIFKSLKEPIAQQQFLSSLDEEPAIPKLKLTEILRFLNNIDQEALKSKNYDVLGLIEAVDHNLLINHFESFKMATEFFIKPDSKIDFKELTDKLQNLATKYYSSNRIKKIISYSLKHEDYKLVSILAQISGRTNNIDKIIDFMTNRSPAELELISQKFLIKSLVRLKPESIKILAEIALKFGDDLSSKQYDELLTKVRNNNNDAKLLASYLLAPDTDYFSKSKKAIEVFNHLNDLAALKYIFASRNLKRFEYDEIILKEKINEIKPLQDNDKLYQNTIKIYELAKKYSALDPIEIHKRSIELQRNRMLLKDNQPADILENDLHFIALSCEAMYRATGKFPRTTQILSTLTAAVMQEGNVGQQISTGQGKTLIGALDTAYLAYTGDKVIITTANKQLARRDLQDAVKFYESLKISSGSDIITVGSEASEFLKHQISYSTSSDIALFFAQIMFDKKPESLQILSRISIVSDELDDTLNRPINYKLAVPLVHVSQQESYILYKTIAKFIETDIFLKSAISADNQVHNLKESIKEKFSKFDTAYTYPLTLTQLAALKKRSEPEAQELYALHQGLEKLKHQDLDSILKTLAIDAVEAKKLVKNKHYVILKEQLDNCNELINAVPVVSERAAKETRFGGGIQGFLHYEIEKKNPELVGRFNYYIPTSIIFDLNAKNLFDNIRMSGGRVFGFSGTLGDEIQRNEFHKTTGIQSINMPDYEKSNKVVERKEVANKAEQDLILYSELADLNSNDPKRPMVIFCPDIESAQEVYTKLEGYGRNIQLADTTSSDDELNEIVTNAGKEGTITITTQVLGIGHDFLTKHPAGFAAFNICTRLTENALGQCEGRIGRNGEQGQITSLFNKELYSEFASHAAFMNHLSLQQTNERERNRVPTDIAQYFNKVNAGDSLNAIKTLNFINKKWKKILISNQRQNASERISIAELKQELIKAVNKEYPEDAKGLSKYLARLSKGLPGADGKINYEKDTYSADYVEQDQGKSVGYLVTHQNYPGLNEARISDSARSVPLERVEKPTATHDEKYQVFYDAFAEAQFTTLYTHILSVDNSDIKQPLDYHIITEASSELDEHEMRLFLQDNKLYCQIKNKQPLEIKKSNQKNDGIPEEVYQRIIAALESEKPFELNERDRIIIKDFALSENYTPAYEIKGEGSSGDLMVHSYKNYYKDYQASVAHSEEIRKVSNIMANMGDIKDIDIAKLTLGKYQAFTISTKVDSEAGHKESILTDGQFLYWINRGYGVEKPGIRIFKVTKDIQNVREVLGSLSIPVSQRETKEKIYSLLREDNDKNVPEYVQVDMDAQTIGNCGYAQTEALLMGAALAGRLDSSGENKLPKVDSRKFQNALTSAKEIYQDLSLSNQMRAFEEVLYIRDQAFVPKYLSQAAKTTINDRRPYLTDPIAQPLFEKITQRFSNNIDIFQNTIYASDASAILKKATIQVILDSAIGRELQRVNSFEASTELLEEYVKSSSTALEDLDKIYNKDIITRVKDGLSRSNLLTEIIKHLSDRDDLEEVLSSLSAALNPNNIVAIDTKNPLKQALFYAVEKGDAAMVGIFKSALGGDVALSAQELSICAELEAKSKNIETPKVITRLEKTASPKENIVIKSDPDFKPQLTEINYSKEAEKLGVNPYFSKRIKNEHQIKFIQDLQAQNKKVDWSNIEIISRVTTEYQAKAEQLGLKPDFAIKISNKYQLDAVVNLEARNERIPEDYILQINNQFQAEATKYLSLYDAIKITNQYQAEATKYLSLSDAIGITNQYQIDAAVNLNARNEAISAQGLLQIDSPLKVEATKYLPLHIAMVITNQYQLDAAVNLNARKEGIWTEGLLKIDSPLKVEATKYLPLHIAMVITNQYQIDAAVNLNDRKENIWNEALSKVNDQYQAEATKWLSLSNSLKVNEEALNQLKLDVSNGKISKYYDRYDEDDTDDRSSSESYDDGIREEGLNEIIRLGVTPEDAKRFTKDQQISALHSLIQKGEKPISSTIDAILQMNNYQMYATYSLSIVDAMKITDAVKSNAFYNLIASKMKYDSVDIDGISKVTNQMQAKAATWLPPRFFLPGLQHVEISNYFQVEALEVLSDQGISLDNIANLAHLDKIENSFQIEALKHLSLVDAVKINDKDKLAILNDYIIKNGKLENQNIDEILLQTKPKLKDEEVAVTILGAINNYLKKNDPLKFPEAAASPISMSTTKPADNGISNPVAKNNNNIPNSSTDSQSYKTYVDTMPGAIKPIADQVIVAAQDHKSRSELVALVGKAMELKEYPFVEDIIEAATDTNPALAKELQTSLNKQGIHYEKLDQYLESKAFLENTQSTLHGINKSLQGVNTIVSAVKLAQEPTITNATAFASKAAQLSSYGVSGVSAAIGIVNATYQASLGAYSNALTSTAYALASLPMAGHLAYTAVGLADAAYQITQGQYTNAVISAAYAANPVVQTYFSGHPIGVAYSTGMLGLTAYSTYQNVSSLVGEFDSKKIKQTTQNDGASKTQGLRAIRDGIPESQDELHHAAYNGDIERIKICATEANINLPDMHGSTPLHIAVLQKDIKTVKALIELGAKVDNVNKKGSTPLHLAAIFSNNDEIIKTLLNNGAKPSPEEIAKHPQYFGKKAMIALFKEAIDSNDSKAVEYDLQPQRTWTDLINSSNNKQKMKLQKRLVEKY